MNINPKVTAAVLAAAVTTIIAWLLTLAGIELPNEVQGAITTILVFAAGYLTSSDGSKGKYEAGRPVVNLTVQPASSPQETAQRVADAIKRGDLAP